MRQFLYFIQAGEEGPIKIGIASNVTKRLSMLQIGNAEELRVLALLECHPSVEDLLHGRFAEGRIRGEWFDPWTPGLYELVVCVHRGLLPKWLQAFTPGTTSEAA
jgi:hypothetical protein